MEEPTSGGSLLVSLDIPQQPDNVVPPQNKNGHAWAVSALPAERSLAYGPVRENPSGSQKAFSHMGVSPKLVVHFNAP